MQNQTYRNQEKKSTLKLVPRANATNDLRLGGTAPDDHMPPGKYLVVCETAWIEAVGQKRRVVLQFRCVDGAFDGVSLRMWIQASDAGGIVSPTSRYARYCELALRRQLESTDPVGDPSQIFAGRFFVVFAGFRKTPEARGGAAQDEHAMRRKDVADFLRAHDLLSREEM